MTALRTGYRTATLILFLCLGCLLSRREVRAMSAIAVSEPPGPDGYAVYYVAPGGECGDVIPCYASVQAAVDAADAGGDVIKVAAGTYTDIHARSGVTQVVYLSNPLTLQGGYTLTNWLVADPVRHPTILNAHGRGRVLYLTGTISPVIEGFQITGGNARGLGGVIVDEWGAQRDVGGGIYLDAAQACLKHTTILSNAAAWGGGIFVGGAQVDFSDNTWAFNVAELGGGGYWFTAESGRLVADTFRANQAALGGGLYVDNSALELTGVRLSLNLAYAEGGGGYFCKSQSVLRGNTWMGNSAARGGGMFLTDHSDVVAINTLVAKNRADLLGAGVYVEASAPHFTHLTLASNRGGDGSGLYAASLVDWWGVLSSTVRLTNTVIADQPVGVWVDPYSHVSLAATLWGRGLWANEVDWQSQGRIVTGTRNLWGDPAFTCTNLDCGRPYRLGASGAALDAGIQTLVVIDIDGEPRPAGAQVDLGADEYSLLSVISPRTQERFVFAFYHPWYDLNTWVKDAELLSDSPLFLHNSDDPLAIRRHLLWSAAAGLDGLLFSWAGQDSAMDAILAQTLDAMEGADLYATAYLEMPWTHFDSVTTTLNDMRYFLNTYSDHPHLLRREGRPVLLLYAAETLPKSPYPTTYAAWQFIVTTLHAEGHFPFLVGDTLDPTYLNIFDGLFYYFPVASEQTYQTLSQHIHRNRQFWMPSFYPGIDDRLLPRPSHVYIPRNQGQTLVDSFTSALRTSPDWLAVASFNEWYENTHIEPSRLYGYDYLLYTADLAARFHRYRAYTAIYVDPAYRGSADGSPARPFRTLDDALFSAADGATIHLAGGEYPGPFTLTQAITLTGGYGPGWIPGTGVSPTVLRGNGVGPVVRVVGDASFFTPTVTLARLIVTGGYAEKGGGVAVQTGALHLDAVRLLRNRAGVGGGFYAGPDAQVWLTNTLIAENTASLVGGGGYVHPSSSLHILHGTITANTAPDVGGVSAWLWPGQPVQMHNSILWGNADRDLHCNPGCDIRYSDVGGGRPGEGNLDVAPGLDAAYHLTPDSPLVDVGDLVSLAPLTDLEGEPRLLGWAVDIGADEFNPILRSSLSADPLVSAPGAVLTYTVRLVNPEGLRTRFTVTDTLSSWTRYISGSAQATVGTVLPPALETPFLPEQLVWTGDLNPNQALTLRFAVTVLSATLETCETITNVAVFQTAHTTFTRSVITARGPRERVALTIETAPGGYQPWVASQAVTRGVSLSLYAAAYNGCGQYLGPALVSWQTAGALPPQTGVGTCFDFTPALAGSAGQIVAEAGGLRAQTGRLSVVWPPELTLPALPLSGTQPVQTAHTYPLTLTNDDALSLTYALAPAFVEPFAITYTWDAGFFINSTIVGARAPLAHPEWTYYFAPEQSAPRFVGAQVAVTEVDMQVYGVNLAEWVNWDWEVYLSDGDMAFPEGQFFATRSNPIDSYVRTMPVWFTVSIGERQTSESYRYHVFHNFVTGEVRVTPFLTGDSHSRSLPLAIQDGLHAQMFLWTGDSRVAQQFDGLRLTVRGVATYTTSPAAWLTAQPANGVVPPRATESVLLHASSLALLPGVHTGALWLRTNDPARAFTRIPFSLTVEPARLHLPIVVRTFGP